MSAAIAYGVPVIETSGAGAHPRGASPSRGGLTAAAAVVLITVVTLVVGLLSAATGHGFGLAFTLSYSIVTIYLAVRIYVEDRFVAVFAPPLAYAFALFVAGFVDSTESAHSLVRVLENTFVNLAFGAPWLVSTTVIAIIIAIVRGRRDAVASHR